MLVYVFDTLNKDFIQLIGIWLENIYYVIVMLTIESWRDFPVRQVQVFSLVVNVDNEPNISFLLSMLREREKKNASVRLCFFWDTENLMKLTRKSSHKCCSCYCCRSWFEWPPLLSHPWRVINNCTWYLTLKRT